jgi:hypothetical protein
MEPPTNLQFTVDEIGAVFAPRRRPKTLPDLPDPFKTGEKSGQEGPQMKKKATR